MLLHSDKNLRQKLEKKFMCKEKEVMKAFPLQEESLFMLMFWWTGVSISNPYGIPIPLDTW